MMRGLLTATMLAGAIIVTAACGSSNNNGNKQAATIAATQAAAPVAASRAATPAAATPARAAAAIVPGLTATPATNPVERVSGTVASVDGNKVTLKEGGSFTLSPQTAITRRVNGSAADLKSGAVVAVTAKRQPDNTLLASLITVFPTAPN